MYAFNCMCNCSKTESSKYYGIWYKCRLYRICLLFKHCKGIYWIWNEKKCSNYWCRKYSSILNYEDRNTCFIFGDGAGAAIISATNNKDEAIIDVECSSDGNYEDLIKTPGGGSKIHVHKKF